MIEKDRSNVVGGKFRLGLVFLLAVIAVVLIAIVPAAISRLSDNIDDEQMSQVDVDVAARVEIYQAMIDKTESEEELLMYLNMRLEYILSIDMDFQYGDIAVADAVAIDDIAQSVSSAGQVANVAFSYKRNEVAEEYLSKMMDRQGITGDESFGSTRG